MHRDEKSELKHKIRKLKHVEKAIRAQNNISSDIPLVWDKFFDLRDEPMNETLHTLSKLISMDKGEFKHVLDDFFARVYYEVYTYKGIIHAAIYDPALLARLDLPPVADGAAVRKRFRELVKIHHPDAGGDPDSFIALMDLYRALH
jgi:hypothetical protein